MSLNNSPRFISVIVTTYNRPDALALVLQGLSRQTKNNFEVLIADDGSTNETKTLINSQSWNFPNKHIWHEDKGFRAALIRNLAVKEAQGDYLIFMDGDCIPQSDFIERHSKLAEKGWFISGSRLLLNRTLTEDTVAGKNKILDWNFWHWLIARLSGQCNRILPLLYVPFFPRKTKFNEWRGAKTCNLAMWHEDFNRVKGFNEQFVGWGYEDSDLVVRLLRANIRRKLGQYAVTVLHLWHKENDRQHEADNWSKLIKTQNSSSIVPDNE